MSSNISGEILFFNIFYEIVAFCTSIVAEDESGKEIWDIKCLSVQLL